MSISLSAIPRWRCLNTTSPLFFACCGLFPCRSLSHVPTSVFTNTEREIGLKVTSWAGLAGWFELNQYCDLVHHTFGIIACLLIFYVWTCACVCSLWEGGQGGVVLISGAILLYVKLLRLWRTSSPLLFTLHCSSLIQTGIQKREAVNCRKIRHFENRFAMETLICEQ